MLRWIAAMKRATARRSMPAGLRAMLVALTARDGVAAVEFAFIAPVLILLYVGAAELSQAVMTSRKVTLLSRTLTDLTARQGTSFQTQSTPPPANAVSQGVLQNILTASTAILSPASLTPLIMTISAIDVVNKPSGQCCNFNVRWSYTQGGTLRPCNVPLTLVSPSQAPSATTVPLSLLPPVASLTVPLSILVSDVAYAYSGPFSATWISFAAGLSQTTYSLPRTTGQVIVQGPLAQIGNQTGVICY